MANRKFPPFIPNTDCDCVPSVSCKNKPCFPCGMTLEEQIMHVNDKVEIQSCTYNQVMKECYKTLDYMRQAAEENGAYYGKDEVWSEDGYFAEENAIYTITHKADKDRRNIPIEMVLYLPFGNTSNAKVEQDSFNASYGLCADKLLVAQPKTANGWYGIAFYNGAPIESFNDGTLYTVGFTKTGEMKVYQNGMDKTQLMKDCIINAMGCSGMLIKDGTITDESYRSGIPNALEQVQRVAIGQNSKTKEVMILTCGKENSTNKNGLTSEACAKILLQKGCDIAVEICEAENAGAMDKGGFMFTPANDNVPTAYCYWAITRKPQYAGDYVREIAELTQKYGRVIWEDYLTNGKLTTETKNRIAADNELQENINAEADTRAEADAVLQENINKEQARAEAAETQLQKNIDAEATTRKNADTDLQNKIDAEVTRAKAAEAAEQTRAEAAETQLQKNIDAEATTRKNADTDLQNKIDAEVTRAKAAEAAEQTRAEAAETQLQTNIDKCAKLAGDNTFTGVNSFENADTVFTKGFSVKSADKTATTFTAGLTVSGANGEINFSGNSGKVSGLKAPTDNGDAVNKKYVDVNVRWSTPENYGAIGDGVNDDTDAINACLAKNENVIFTKTYKVKADKNNYNGSTTPDNYTYGISVPSNRVLLFDNNAQLMGYTSNAKYSAVLYLNNVNDVTIIGANIKGDRETNTQTTGEWGHGIVARAANNVIIKDTIINSCFGDGIMIGAKTTAANDDTIGENISISTCKIYNNRRQGVTISGGKNITIENCEIYGMNGTAPKAGIDIEPNYDNVVVSNVLISNCYFHDNAGYDITNGNGIQTGIVIDNCRCMDVIQAGTGDFTINGGFYRGINPKSEHITISNVEIEYIFGNPKNMVVKNSKIKGNDADGYTIAFDTIQNGDLTLISCEIADVRNIIIKLTNTLTLIGCNIKHTTNRTFCTSGNIRAYNTVFDFSNENVTEQPFNCTSIELNNCDFYYNGKGQLLSISDATLTKEWINNRFHNPLAALSYKANKLICNRFNFSYKLIASSAKGERIGNIWSDLNEGQVTDAEKTTWNNKAGLSTTNIFSGKNTFNGDVVISKTPTSDTQAANKKYVDEAVATGGGGDVTAAGNNTFSGTNNFTGEVNLSKDTIISTKLFVDAATTFSSTSVSFDTGTQVVMGDNVIENVGDCVNDTDATNKKYVDRLNYTTPYSQTLDYVINGDIIIKGSSNIDTSVITAYKAYLKEKYNTSDSAVFYFVNLNSTAIAPIAIDNINSIKDSGVFILATYN